MDHSESLPMDLLLVGDPSEDLIEKYLPFSEAFCAKLGETIVGGFLMAPISDDELEVKNLSVYPQFQGKGIGMELIKYAIRQARMETYQSLIVKTADVSDHQIEFYKKLKFEHETTVKGHFIQYYKEPVFENGKEAVDQLVFRRKL
ncbi:GNAT family N-acetyltransferase [Marinoscillum sp. MHG1-6]|uniref:GNAT family N-acetyltransferase n=1 Tax=Marinoscillum sp. MHG1-6 TaxID=2959627 RepID=UPI002158886B|nr:GNAT family N-acetyltransferase [Marinoscillum sp. MHG1-6]